MDPWMIVTMGCVGVGFLLFGALFWGFMNKWKTSRLWVLGIIAFLLVTVIPVIIALSHAI